MEITVKTYAQLNLVVGGEESGDLVDGGLELLHLVSLMFSQIDWKKAK